MTPAYLLLIQSGHLHQPKQIALEGNSDLNYEAGSNSLSESVVKFIVHQMDIAEDSLQ
jgi:hypothetical protein